MGAAAECLREGGVEWNSAAWCDGRGGLLLLPFNYSLPSHREWGASPVISLIFPSPTRIWFSEQNATTVLM